MSDTLSSWLLQWGQVHFVLWTWELFIWVAGSLFLSRASYLFIPAVLVIWAILRYFALCLLIFSKILGRAVSRQCSACFKMSSVKNSFFVSLFFPRFLLSFQHRENCLFSWPGVVYWWIWPVLILASVPCPLLHLCGAVVARVLPSFSSVQHSCGLCRSFSWSETSSWVLFEEGL